MMGTMLSRLPCVLVVAAAVVPGLATGCDRSQSHAGPATAPSGDSVVLDDTVHGFRLQYPKGWEARKPPAEKADHVVANLVHPSPKAGQAGDALVMTYKVHDGRVSLPKTLDLAEESAAKRLTEFKVVSRSDTTLGGERAAQLVYTGKTAKGQGVETTIIAAVFPGNRAVTIAFSTDPQRYGQARDVLAAIVRSFEVTEPDR